MTHHFLVVHPLLAPEQPFFFPPKGRLPENCPSSQKD